MIDLPVTLHDGVRVSSSGGTARITDPATGTDEQITSDAQSPYELEAVASAFLLINGLARADRATRLEVMDRANVRETSTRHQVHRWGNLRRTLAPPGSRWLLAHALRGVSRTWGAAVAIISILVSLNLTSLGADLMTTLEFAASPLLVLLVTAAHETGHWIAVRRHLGGESGALLVGWNTCAVTYAATKGGHRRLIALAGPLAGASTAGLTTAIFSSSPSLATVGGLLVVVNLLGLTPLTQDGRDALTAQEDSSTKTP